MDNAYQRKIHRVACMVGGFAGIYMVLIRLNLGSSQTLNLLELLNGLLGRNYAEAALRLFGAFLYGGSIFVTTILMKKTKIDMMLFSTALNIIGFIVMGLMPDEVNACVALYPTFVMMSVQWVVFGGLGGYNSSPIFSTNNLRQMSAAFAEYLCDRKSEHLDKAKYFAGSIFFFHLGAALGFVACKLFAVKAAYFGIIPCVLLSAMVVVPKLSYSKRTFRSNLLSALLTQTHL